MPSGIIITDAEIASIQKGKGTCKVFVPDTGAHFTAEISDLIVPKSDSKTDIRNRVRKKKPLTAWEEWEELCTDNIDDIWEQWQ